jgi:hypothetical protein
LRREGFTHAVAGCLEARSCAKRRYYCNDGTLIKFQLGCWAKRSIDNTVKGQIKQLMNTATDPKQLIKRALGAGLIEEIL